MKPSATIPDHSAPDRYRTLALHALQATVLAVLVAAMGVCLALGPRLAALLLP